MVEVFVLPNLEGGAAWSRWLEEQAGRGGGPDHLEGWWLEDDHEAGAEDQLPRIPLEDQLPR